MQPLLSGTPHTAAIAHILGLHVIPVNHSITLQAKDRRKFVALLDYTALHMQYKKKNLHNLFC